MSIESRWSKVTDVISNSNLQMMIGTGKVEETLSSIISMDLCLHSLRHRGPTQWLRNDLPHVQWSMHLTTLSLDLLREVRD